MTTKRLAPQLLVGRAMLAALFLVSGLGKIGRFAAVAGFMTSKGLPAAELLLVSTILLEVGCALALLVGWHTRTAAWLLMAFTALASILFHAFWSADTPTFQNQFNHFLKNGAIMGGLMYLGAIGAGAWSLDARIRS